MGAIAKKVIDFTRMNPVEFYGSKVNKDLQECLKVFHKIVDNYESNSSCAGCRCGSSVWMRGVLVSN